MSSIEGSPVVVHDDDGQPITEQDLVTESYREPLRDSVAGLMPPIAFEGDEDEWEEQQLIEAPRRRHRPGVRLPVRPSTGPSCRQQPWG